MKEETKVNSTYERTSDLANIAQLAPQASACAASAMKPTLRERLEATRKVTEEATQLAHSIHDCLFGKGLNGETAPQEEPENVYGMMDCLKWKLDELCRVLKEVGEKL